MSFDDHLHGLTTRYVAAPQWVKSIAGGAYSKIPPDWRFGRAYSEFRRLFEAPSVDDEYVVGRLSDTLVTALETVPAFEPYRRLAPQAIESPRQILLELPLTAKEDIKKNLRDYVSVSQPESARLKMFTGGSTSVPMTFFLHKRVSRAKEWAAFHAMGERFGTEGEGVILALRGRTVTSAGRGRLWMYEPIKRHLIVSSDHLEPRYMPEYLRVLKEWRPSYVHAFPSALFPLISWLRDQGEDNALDSVKGVLLTSESVFEHHMAAFRSFFRCPVVVHYGHTERVLFANTLPDDPRYHFWPHYGHLELLDPAGRPITRAGVVGELVGTSFDNAVMPFVRYRTGDYAVWSDKPSALAGYPVCERLEGRRQEFVVCEDHRLITVTTLGAAHFQELDRCLRIQYEQHEPGRLTLRVVPLHPLTEAARRNIAEAVRQKTQGGCRIEVVEVDNIPLTQRGKQQLLVQHLNIEQFLGAAMNRTERGVDLPIAGSDAAQPGEEASVALSAEPRTALQEGSVVLMVGTAPENRGGIAAVVSALRDGGLFDRVSVRYVVSHVEGGMLSKVAQFFRAFAAEFRWLSSGRVAVVHAHVSSKGSFWRKSMLLWLARCFRKPTVFHLHSGGFDDFAAKGLGGPMLRWWIRHTLEASTAVIVLSHGWARWIRSFAPAARIEVVGNPVVVPPVLPSPAGRASAQGGGRVLFLGLICELKGCYDLLKAWAEARPQLAGWRLAVGGNGEVEEFLAEAKRLGIADDIDYLGWVSGDAKQAELARADVFVLPSYKEGMPVSLLEAMANGVAVIATPVGGVPDMMEADRHGLWVRPGDVAGLAKALATMAAAPSLRLSLAQAARTQVDSRNSVPAVIEQLERIYGMLSSAPTQATRSFP